MHHCFFFISLKNIGSEPAAKITVKLAPDINGPDCRPVNELEIFRDIGFFAPGREFLILVGSSAGYFATDQPTQVTAAISYSDETGRRYTESIPITSTSTGASRTNLSSVATVS